DLANLTWYTVFVLWKLAVLYEYGRRRAVRGVGDPYYADQGLVRSFLEAAHRTAGLEPPKAAGADENAGRTDEARFPCRAGLAGRHEPAGPLLRPLRLQPAPDRLHDTLDPLRSRNLPVQGHRRRVRDPLDRDRAAQRALFNRAECHRRV